VFDFHGGVRDRFARCSVTVPGGNLRGAEQWKRRPSPTLNLRYHARIHACGICKLNVHALAAVIRTAVIPALLLAWLSGWAVPSPLQADEIRVAVASNFRQAMAAAAQRFKEDSGHVVVLIPGSTGKHYAQIRNGAPFDAFFAADADRPLRLEQEGRSVPGSRFTYAIGQIVLWSPDAGMVDPAGAVLQSDRFRHLAIANPDLAPYGAAARSVLQALGLWDELAPKLVRGENIGQTFQFVISGNAELGFVARSQLEAPGRESAGSSWPPPRGLYPPIEQQAVLLRDSPVGRAFLTFMQGEEARAIVRAYGYDSP
jgi:molybdate transport system substrate-binding protein